MRCIDQAFEVVDHCLESEVGYFPVGEPVPALIVTDERTHLREGIKPVPPNRAFPVILEMRHPMRSPHHRRTVAANRVRDLHTIPAPTKSDVLKPPLPRGTARRTQTCIVRSERIAQYIFHAVIGAPSGVEC